MFTWSQLRLIISSSDQFIIIRLVTIQTWLKFPTLYSNVSIWVILIAGLYLRFCAKLIALAAYIGALRSTAKFSPSSTPTHLSTINKLMHSIKIINRITEHVQFVFRTGSFVPAWKDNSRSSNPHTHSIRGQSALFNRLNKTYLALLVTSKFKVLASL